MLVDVHLEVAGEMSVAEGHQIARQARERVLAQHPVLNVMVHLDPSDAASALGGLTKAAWRTRCPEPAILLAQRLFFPEP